MPRRRPTYRELASGRRPYDANGYGLLPAMLYDFVAWVHRLLTRGRQRKHEAEMLAEQRVRQEARVARRAMRAKPNLDVGQRKRRSRRPGGR